VLETFMEAGITFVPIDLVVAESAVAAFARFGRGRGGKAQLVFGDCLSHARARVNQTSLLFKGADFAATDVRRA
jgi:ribonuclease VapC